MIPIWLDYYVTLDSSASTGVAFRILCDGAVIYSGVSWPRPDSTEVSVKINDICADYLTRALPLEGSDYYDMTFTVQKYDTGSSAWVDVEEVTFTRNWSYDDSFDVDSDVPVAPITKRLHPSQYLPIFSNNGTFEATIYGDYTIDFNLDFATAGYVSYLSDGITYFLDLSQYSNLGTIVANGITYKVEDLCGGYVLYYINAYGGWDSLPIEGNTSIVDALTRYTKEKVYNNGTYPARGKDNYVNEVERRFKFNIGPLTADEASRMHHLLNSTYVYLHDIEKGRIHPLVLTGTSYETKERRGVFHFYQVEAALAQDRTRR